IGSITYGFVPADFIAQYAGPDNPLAIPFAAIIGVPLYIRAEAVIPLAAALAAKGMGMGALMALIIGSAGASLTEVILLKSLFRNPMIVAFLVVIFAMAIAAGFSESSPLACIQELHL
ncbi:permease, partial [Endozoicomonas sp. ONNA2]|uniref:permease n=1 Tax=Endozoicomonas sp. ONNA2 TaxID=2828741 RepID=UPI0021499636